MLERSACPKVSWLWVLLACARFVTSSSEQCPWLDDLTPWSDATAWPSNQVPQANTSVIIDNRQILLDVSPPPLFSLTIRNGGRLVWGVNGDHELRANYILVEEMGELEIGSAVCKFPQHRKATITLTGKRDDYLDVGNFGQKFLGARTNGTLEIHGANTFTWTVLTQTARKPTIDDGLIWDHDVNGKWNVYISGVYLYTFEPNHGNMTFDGQYSSNQYSSLANDIDNIPHGTIVMLAVRGKPLGSDRTAFDNAIESLGSTKIREFVNGNAFAMVAVKGDSSLTKETLSSEIGFTHTSTGPVDMTTGTLRFIAESAVSVRHMTKLKAHQANYVRFRVILSTMQTILNVLDDVSSLSEGDKLVISSTDFDMIQAEERVVVPCPTCSNYQVAVNVPLYYTHWGEVTNNVDMRAEVALLNRNVVIRGEMQPRCYGNNPCAFYDMDTFGGHVKADGGSLNIEGVELYHMGQAGVLASYPIHYHLLLDDAGAIVKNNVVRHSFQRCIVIHGTFGLQVMDNIAYLHFGHCYYLEDGGEHDNVLNGNLGLGTLSGHLHQADKTPATFWLTNPYNFIKNNVAAGSEEWGFMIIFPKYPKGLSEGLIHLQSKSDRTALAQFENNKAHSNTDGLFGDFILQGDLTSESILKTGNNYKPRSEAQITRFTGYKNKHQDSWYRGSPIHLSQSSFSDSPRGHTHAVAGYRRVWIENSVFVGQSDNLGEPEIYYDRTASAWVKLPRSFPSSLGTQVNGLVIYDLNIHLRNCYFNGFQTDQYRKAGGIGWKRNAGASFYTYNSVENLTFGFKDGEATGNRVFEESGGRNGNKGAMVVDIDGSLTGHAGASVVRNEPFYYTANCYEKTNWNMRVCPEKYGKIRIRYMKTSTNTLFKSDVQMVRDDLHHHREIFTTRGGIISVNLIYNHNYTMQFIGKAPNKIRIETYGFEKYAQFTAGGRVRLGICFPKNSAFTKIIYARMVVTLKATWEQFEAASLTDQAVAFWDNDTGLLFFYLRGQRTRDPTDLLRCPRGACAFLDIERTGPYEVADCYQDAYGPYSADPLPPDENALSDMVLNSSPMPSGVGAGRTREAK
ncbi:cell surface hyaluronidase [Lingula anatina]|uniref:Cell surface hyaluronidase n=1 Tax=Lingula anatina TaxID=7574 RepID=A0A1S3J8K6_LINAN|nr:cell surface hyaluronidase [Lingula anatina]|eukprot:XP_013406737.1 cell surface hyaluronidase [Lingula anatina]